MLQEISIATTIAEAKAMKSLIFVGQAKEVLHLRNMKDIHHLRQVFFFADKLCRVNCLTFLLNKGTKRRYEHSGEHKKSYSHVSVGLQLKLFYLVMLLFKFN